MRSKCKGHETLAIDCFRCPVCALFIESDSAAVRTMSKMKVSLFLAAIWVVPLPEVNCDALFCCPARFQRLAPMASGLAARNERHRASAPTSDLGVHMPLNEGHRALYFGYPSRSIQRPAADLKMQRLVGQGEWLTQPLRLITTASRASRQDEAESSAVLVPGHDASRNGGAVDCRT